MRGNLFKTKNSRDISTTGDFTVPKKKKKRERQKLRKLRLSFRRELLDKLSRKISARQG